MNEVLLFAFLIAAGGFVATYILCLALNFVIALKAPPNRRATWTVGIAYAVVSIAAVASIILISRDPSAPKTPFPIDPLEAPLLLVPGTIIIFLLLRWGYRSAWIDEAEDLPEGVKRANDDWRRGAIALLAIVALLAARALFRLFMHGGLQ
jgi:hypothetical protein